MASSCRRLERFSLLYVFLLLDALFALPGSRNTGERSSDASGMQVIEVTRIVEVTRLVEVTLTRQDVGTKSTRRTEPTDTPVGTESKAVPTNAPTATNVAAFAFALPIPTSTAAPSNMPASIPTTTPTPEGPRTHATASLHNGPGTNCEIAGAAEVGVAPEIVGRAEDSSWYQLADENWIATFLVDNPPPIVAIAPTVPEPPTATPVPTDELQQMLEKLGLDNDYPSHVGIGEMATGKVWEFRVTEMHKRRAVYWRSDSRVVFGHYLILIIENRNLQSGTDYFSRTLKPYIVRDSSSDDIYHIDRSATVCATWQYGGLGTYGSDLNPGAWGKIVAVYDLPDDVGETALSTAIPTWVHLGDFSTMPSED